MPKIRCNNPLCSAVIHFEKGFDQVNSRYFCDSACSLEYSLQTRRFEDVADPFRNDEPLNYKPKRWCQVT